MDVLTEHEIAEIDKEIKKFPKREAACLDALMAVQKIRGYISDETLKAVADYLGMSTAELDGIATFYNLIFRKPVGRCVIRLCDSVSCWILGYEQIRQAIKEKLAIDWGETTADQQFTLLPAQCLGCCDKAPALMINDTLYTNVTITKLSEILQTHEGQRNRHGETSDTDHAQRWTAGRSKGVLVC